MTDGIFKSLSGAYFRSSGNAFYFVKNAPWFLKPLAFLLSVLYAIIMLPVGALFGLLIVFDWIGGLTDALRRSLLRFMDRQSQAVNRSFGSFLLRPILVVLIAPLFLVSVFIPKLSSHALANMAANEVSDAVSGAGAFKQINGIIWGAANRLFQYVAGAPLALKPIAAVIAVLYSLVLILVGAVFLLLVPLDWVSRLIESMRQGVVRYVNGQQMRIRYQTSAFLFAPLLLVVLAPVFLAIILVPKFTTNLDVEV